MASLRKRLAHMSINHGVGGSNPLIYFIFFVSIYSFATFCNRFVFYFLSEIKKKSFPLFILETKKKKKKIPFSAVSTI